MNSEAAPVRALRQAGGGTLWQSHFQFRVISRHSPSRKGYKSKRSDHLRLIEEECAAYLDVLPASDPDWPEDVRRMASSIYERLFDPGLTVAELCEELMLNDNNVSGHFAFYVGQGIKRYIDGHRLEMARRLLCLDTLKISEVAHAVGYKSQSAFSKAFRRFEDCTPSQFRERFRKTERDLSSSEEE